MLGYRSGKLAPYPTLAMGIYTYLPGEQQAVFEYGAYVESVREWARLEREKEGL